MRIPFLVAGLGSLLVLSACQTLTPAEIRARDEQTCRGYGFKPRTQGFAECLQRIDLSRRADRRAALYGDYGVYGGGFYPGGVGFGVGYGRWGW